MAVMADTDAAHDLSVQMGNQYPCRRSSLKKGDILMRVVMRDQETAFVPQRDTRLLLASTQIVDFNWFIKFFWNGYLSVEADALDAGPLSIGSFSANPHSAQDPS